MCAAHRAWNGDGLVVFDRCQECLNAAVAAGRAAFAAQQRVSRPCSNDPGDPPMSFTHLVEFLKGVNYPNHRLDPVPSRELARALVAAGKQQRLSRSRGLLGERTRYDGGWRFSDVAAPGDGTGGGSGGERITLMSDGTLVVERYLRGETTSRTVRRPRVMQPTEVMVFRAR